MEHHSGGKPPAVCGDGYTSMDTAKPCNVQTRLGCQDGFGGQAAELQLPRGSQSTLNPFCGTKEGTEGIRLNHVVQYLQHSQEPHHLPTQYRLRHGETKLQSASSQL